MLNTPEHTSQLLSENVLQNQNLPCCKHGKMIHIVQVFLTHSKLWKNVGDAQNIHLDVLFWNTNGSEVCLLTAWSSFLASYSSVKIKGRDFYSCQTEVVLLLLHWSDSPWLSANTEGGDLLFRPVINTCTVLHTLHRYLPPDRWMYPLSLRAFARIFWIVSDRAAVPVGAGGLLGSTTSGKLCSTETLLLALLETVKIATWKKFHYYDFDVISIHITITEIEIIL